MHARRLLIALAAFLALAAPADAATGWAGAGTLGEPREEHAAVLLDSGKVLVAGGQAGGNPGGNVPNVAKRTADLYDPATGTWSPAAAMNDARYYFGLVKLRDGRALAVGGFGTSRALTAAEVYDPATNRWSGVASMRYARESPALVPLADGRVLSVGGRDGSNYVGPAEIYSPEANRWDEIGPVTTPRIEMPAALLRDGRVVIAGGYDGSAAIRSGEELKGAGWSVGAPFSIERSAPGLSLLADGRPLVTGGSSGTAQSSTEFFNGAAWQPAAAMATPRWGHTQTTLPNGQVLVAGGASTGVFTSATELYNPNANAWSSAGSLSTARFRQTATLLLDGRVLLTGGSNGVSTQASAEIYTGQTAFSAPTALAFGTQTAGTGRTLALQVTNTGDLPLLLGSVALGGANPSDFAVNADSCRVVPAGATCVIDVAFTPAGADARDAVLTFSANTAAGTHAVALSGSGVAAAADADGDGVADPNDRCRTLKGAASRQGCPKGLLADPSIRYRPSGKGIRVLAYYVKATTGARVRVKCSKGCRSTTTKGKGSRRVRITRLNHRRLAHGAKITITVTMTGRLTTTVVDRVTRGRRIEGRPRCTPVGC